MKEPKKNQNYKTQWLVVKRAEYQCTGTSTNKAWKEAHSTQAKKDQKTIRDSKQF